MFKVSAESILTEQEDVDKQVELQEVQSDYPRSTDPERLIYARYKIRRWQRSPIDVRQHEINRSSGRASDLMSSLNLLILEINVLSLKNAVLLKTDQ